MKTRINIERISLTSVEKAGIDLYMARADQIHPLASGNKFYKLKPHIAYALTNNYKELVSFGGAFSNHIHALAMMSDHYQIKSTGIIRGEAEYATNPTLSAARAAGMHLRFVNRKEYQLRNDKHYLADLKKQYPKALIIPEGGSSQFAISGCIEMVKDINHSHSPDIVTIASGTGASFAGLVCGLEHEQQAISYVVLRDQSIKDRIASFIENEGVENTDYSIKQADYGGYAKLDESHLDFILDWLEKTGILLDPIYTSKMCRCIIEQINAGDFQRGTSITMVHSGGLQGWLGMKEKVIRLGGESSWLKISYTLKNGPKVGG